MAEKNEMHKSPKAESKNPQDDKTNAKAAFEQAEEDIENDPETKLNEDEDLDEGELARKEGHP
ncbi:MAG TPA: hypothetical protein VIJ75_12880 [Hanamia sp.]